MNIEQNQLPLAVLSKNTQKLRESYLPLGIANSWGKLVEKSTDTKLKTITGFVGMMGVVALSMYIDGNFGLAASEGLAVVGGATVGEKLPFLSLDSRSN